MNTEQIRNIAIRRHDEDAGYFQSVYSKGKDPERLSSFEYGRNMILEELEIILHELPKGSKILDVGCGTAHLTKWMQNKGFSVYGVEPSENMRRYAAKNFPDIDIKNGLSTDIPYPDNYFDLVIAIEVLRYLDKADNIATYCEFQRVLKTKGQFFVTQVNVFCTDLYYIFHHVKGLWRRAGRQTHPHCNFTTYAKQQKIAIENGFTDVRTIGRMEGSIRILFKFGNAIGNLYARIIEKITNQKHSKSILKLFSGHLIVLGRKN